MVNTRHLFIIMAVLSAAIVFMALNIDKFSFPQGRELLTTQMPSPPGAPSIQPSSAVTPGPGMSAAPSPSPVNFCGWSTFGVCSRDNDCLEGGCSGQVCRSKSEEGFYTTCEWRDCYNARAYGLACRCVDSRCQWAE